MKGGFPFLAVLFFVAFSGSEAKKMSIVDYPARKKVPIL